MKSVTKKFDDPNLDFDEFKDLLSNCFVGFDEYFIEQCRKKANAGHKKYKGVWVKIDLYPEVESEFFDLAVYFYMMYRKNDIKFGELVKLLVILNNFSTDYSF